MSGMVEVLYVEKGTFQGGEEDTFKAGIRPGDECVVLSAKEYRALQKSAEWLACLEAAGVDNWGGYDDARQIQRDTEDAAD